MGVLYQLAFGTVLLLAGPLLLLLRRRHYLPTIRGRLGLELPAGPTDALWFHAVSVGEAMVACSVIAKLPSKIPVIVTTITPTGQARAKALIGDRGAVTYLPFDLAWTLDPFLARLRPRALVLVEGDYWPLLLSRVKRLALPSVVINTRVGDTTFRRLRRWPFANRRLMGRVDRFGVQSEQDRSRLIGLGIDAERVQVTGNLKYEAARPKLSSETRLRIEGLAAGRPVLVAGSTMAGEDEMVLDAFTLCGGGRTALLVLAPRHPERWDAVAAEVQARGLALVRRSKDSAASGDVLLLDSLGELAGIYELATASFIGGTLVTTGGHNPLEPARYGIPIAVGPSMENFRDMANQFDRAEAWTRVQGVQSLAETWRGWLDDPPAAQRVGQRADKLVLANQGAMERTLELLQPILAEFPEC
ncbi:MAG: 3-deoxy-D-manno-octulosonic acid transferase [Thermoanaerobaculia bacterium]|nr:3-deoxy-D-manno-octulosonic acid transferase [Thermoanaerobaculia bacterium]